MKILSASQMQDWDKFTMIHEPIASIDIMERAATKCTAWLIANCTSATSFAVFCGKGNNGGDGLAIARMIIEKNISVKIYILEFGFPGTPDFQSNLARLHKITNEIHFIEEPAHFPALPSGVVLIDALLGSGLNRKPIGLLESLLHHINQSALPVISIDLPSGMFSCGSSFQNTKIIAAHTLTFQALKLAFLLPENEKSTGQVHILDIGLHPRYLSQAESKLEMITAQLVRSLHKPRKRFSHKGNFGHALLIAGSAGKMGAAILSSRACMRSGAGLLTIMVPEKENDIMQISVPEAMTITYPAGLEQITADLTTFNAIGFGPGFGTTPDKIKLAGNILEQCHAPMLIDADALNCISIKKEFLSLIPAGSILTPHTKEFDRLFGEHTDHYARIISALNQAANFNCIIILKGQHTFIATPQSKGYFNTTGNAGMATAGSGDVLSGVLTGLLAQGYSSLEAAILGVYLHGSAGDYAITSHSIESMIAGDIIETLGDAFKAINTR